MCSNWDALVLDNYEAVMPLPWRRKWGLTYLYQPYFTASLGVFSEMITETLVQEFIHSIPRKFIYWDIMLNEQNTFSDLQPAKSGIKITRRSNYLLHLNDSYTHIRSHYSRLAGRKIKVAKASGLEVHRGKAAAEIVDLYIQHYAGRHAAIDALSYNSLKHVATQLNPGAVQTYYAHFREGEPAAFYLVVTDTNNVYSILGGSTGKGKKNGAFFFLTDEVIKANAGHKKMFRFEGSDLEGIAFFNRQFNPAHIHYTHLKFNGLPFPLKLFKR
jgi:hypothetical protein